MLARPLAVTFLLAAAVVPCFGQEAEPANLLTNGSFEDVTENNPAYWSLGTHGNDANLTAVELPDGTHALKLECTRFERGWVIAAQDGVVKIKKGQWYRLTFRARAEDLKGGCSIAIYQRKPWKSCGLVRGFVPGEVWQDYEMGFEGALDADDTRFEFFFSATGALFLDDVKLVIGDRPLPASALPPAPGKNSVRNASFELGKAWWGSFGADVLQGEIAGGGVDGGSSLEIIVDPATADVYWEDWYEVERYQVLQGSAVSQGWAQVDEGEIYCLSAYLRSDTLPLRATLRVNCFPKGSFSKTVDVTKDWQRFEATGKVTGPICFVSVTIEDLPKHGEPVPEGAGPWHLFVDAVQLEKGKQATDFEPRHPVEIALSTDRPGNVFFLPEQPSVLVHVYNSTEDFLSTEVRAAAVDAWDREVASGAIDLKLAGGTAGNAPVRLATPRGFFRVKAALGDAQADMRMALVEELRSKLAGKPGKFGINHASPSDLRMDLWQQGGMSWVRDWSYKWNQVQANEGAPFDFSLQDPQIDRCLARGMHVLLCLPECSTLWTTTAPQELTDKGGRARRGAFKYPPSDLEQYAAYVAATVEHTRDRVQWFEVINEPGEALPPEKYTPIMQAAWEAAKAVTPAARIIGGKSAGPAAAFGWYQGFLGLGAVQHMDAINVHLYPGNAPPRGLESSLAKLNEEMDKQGGRRPIWCTEWLYGADDDPAPTVAEWPPTGRVASELIAARFDIEFYVVCMANGVEKFFQHTSHWPTRLNRATLFFDSFFEYRAEPRKAFAAHNAMVSLLGSDPKFVCKLEMGEDRVGRASLPDYGAAFATDYGASAVVLWREAGRTPVRMKLACAAHDLMGVPIEPGAYELGQDPIYVVSDTLPPARLAREVERLLRTGGAEL